MYAPSPSLALPTPTSFLLPTIPPPTFIGAENLYRGKVKVKGFIVDKRERGGGVQSRERKKQMNLTSRLELAMRGGGLWRG